MREFNIKDLEVVKTIIKKEITQDLIVRILKID